MFSKFQTFWKLLDLSEKKKFSLLFLGMLVSSLFEFLSIGSLIPFLVNLSAHKFSGSNPLTQKFILFFDDYSQEQIPVIILILVTVKFLITLLTNFAQTHLSKTLQLRLALNLYKRFINLSLSEAESTHHVSINRLMEDIDHTSNELFKNFCWLFNHLFLSISLLTLLLFSSLYAFSFGVILFTSFLFIYSLFIRPKYSLLGTTRLKLKKSVMGLVDTFHHNVIEAHAFKMKNHLLRNFSLQYESLVDVNKVKLLNQLNARPTIEFFGVISVLIFYYAFSLHDHDKGTQLVNLSLLTIILMRLAPSLGKIYSSFNAIVFSRPYIEELEQFLNKRSSDLSLIELPTKELTTLEFANVSYLYDAKSIPQNLSFTIHSPGLYYLKGPNGSGKTTMLKIMTGLLTPKAGKVIFNNSSEFILQFCPAFSFLGQDVFLFPGSIKDNVLIHEKSSDAEWENIVREFELGSLINTHRNISLSGRELSGGEKKMLGLARSLCQKANLVLLDEPFASLDQDKRDLVLKILKKYSLTRIIILTGHQSLNENLFAHTFVLTSE